PARMSTLIDHIPSFLTYLRVERGASPETIDDYGTDLQGFRSFLVDQDKADITPAAVDLHLLRHWLGEEYEGRAPATLARKISAVRSLFRFLVKRGVLESSVADLIQRPKQPVQQRAFMSVDDAYQLLDGPRPDG